MKFKRNRMSSAFHISLIGGLFLVAIILVLFQFISTRVHNLSEDDFGKLQESRYKIISDESTYAVMNAITSPFRNEQGILLIQRETVKFSNKANSFISSIDESILSNHSKKQLARQIKRKQQLWDCEKLLNTQCISTKMAEDRRIVEDSLFSIIHQQDSIEYPDILTYHQFSYPLVDLSNEVIIIQHRLLCGSFCSKEEILLLSKSQGKWSIVDKFSLWVT